MARIGIATGVELEHQVTGEGEPLLLIMGTGGSIPLWAPVLPSLSERFQVIAFDNRGLGGSGPIEDGWDVTMPNIANDAAALMDALEIERAHVLGWSLGSATAQELAINHPDKVGSLTLYSTWASPTDSCARS